MSVAAPEVSALKAINMSGAQFGNKRQSICTSSSNLLSDLDFFTVFACYLRFSCFIYMDHALLLYNSHYYRASEAAVDSLHYCCTTATIIESLKLQSTVCRQNLVLLQYNECKSYNLVLLQLSRLVLGLDHIHRNPRTRV